MILLSSYAMQPHALKIKSYEIPEDLAPEAKAICQELVGDIEKTHAYYKQQIEFIRQQYKIALRSMRPDIVSAAALREMFDEAEMTVNPNVEIAIDDDEAPAPNPKKKKKKKPAIPEHLPREVAWHDVDESAKTCAQDGSMLRPMGYDVKLAFGTIINSIGG